MKSCLNTTSFYHGRPFGFSKKILLYFLALTSIYTFQTIAQQPTQEWVRRYSGLQNHGSNGVSIKLDGTGNIYVLVRVATDTTLGDYGLLKYNTSGDLLWSSFYNSPSNAGELPKAFCVTPAGDVYITGISDLNFAQHIITVKFNSNGILQWAKEYNGGFSDFVNDIALDKQGNIIICGGSAVDNNISYALAVKYNPAGDSLWVRKFNQFQYSYIGKLVVDDSSNVYTAGEHKVNMLQTNYLTLKYTPNGNLAWYYSYGVSGYAGGANSISIDSSRFVYVVGALNVPQPGYEDNVLIKISPNGSMQWAKNYTGINNNHSCGNPIGLSVTPSGNAIYYSTICSIGGGSDIVTLSYNSNGDTSWVRRYPTGIFGIPSNTPNTLKIDKFGSAYVVGYTSNTGVAIKYLNNGTQQWVLSTDSSSGNDITIDSNLVYTTGLGNFNNVNNAVTIKYNQPIGITSNSNELPVNFILYQNYPNPFNGTTIINYEIPIKSFVNISIYNCLGQKVRSFVNTEQAASYYTLIFNTEDLASGVYFYSLRANEELKSTKKLLLIK
jgi:hypothetical protein